MIARSRRSQATAFGPEKHATEVVGPHKVAHAVTNLTTSAKRKRTKATNFATWSPKRAAVIVNCQEIQPTVIGPKWLAAKNRMNIPNCAKIITNRTQIHAKHTQKSALVF